MPSVIARDSEYNLQIDGIQTKSQLLKGLTETGINTAQMVTEEQMRLVPSPRTNHEPTQPQLRVAGMPLLKIKGGGNKPPTTFRTLWRN